jgi:competence protein ComEC
MKYISYFVTAVVLLSCYLLSQWPSSVLDIVFCDVGQGDAILLSYQSTQVLVDGGRNEKVLSCLGENLPFWDKKLEVVIATHPDADHIGGLTAVFDQYASNLIVTNGAEKKTNDFGDFKTSVSRKQTEKTTLLELQQGDSLSIGRDLVLKILSPQELKSQKRYINTAVSETELWDKQPTYSDLELTSNDGSIVVFLEYKKYSMLLMGDLEEDGELALLEKGLVTKVDVLKVGHHGSKSSTSLPFLRTVLPEISVISSGKNNAYNHPTPEILARLSQYGSKIYRTDQQGTLRFRTDGEQIWLY